MVINSLKESQVPVFVVGLPRSGTTLLTQILNASEQIHFGTETHFFQVIDKLSSKVKKEEELIREYLNPNRHIYLQYFPFSEDEWKSIRHDSLPIKSLAQFLNKLCGKEAEKRNISRWGEKTPIHFKYIPKILELFPNAKIINIIRDPRAVFQSHSKVYWGIKSAILLRNRFIENLNIVNYYKNNPNFYSIKYEELITRPKIITESICEFINIEYKASMIDSLGKSALANYNSKLEPWKTSLQHIESSKATSWDTEQNKNINALISFLLKNEIESLGYTRSESIQKLHLFTLLITHYSLFIYNQALLNIKGLLKKH